MQGDVRRYAEAGELKDRRFCDGVTASRLLYIATETARHETGHTPPVSRIDESRSVQGRRTKRNQPACSPSTTSRAAWPRSENGR